MHTALWRRLDQEGHDACRFVEDSGQWNIEGSAVFKSGEYNAVLAYRLVCDGRWRGLSAAVTGWVGPHQIELSLERESVGDWSIDGAIRQDLAGLEDIDFGFTPASNTNAIRRLNLDWEEEAAAAVTVIWLDTEDWTVKPLPQTYRRIGTNSYEYASPLHDYRATLETDDFGAITRYPGLWVMVP